jgi:diacylglycerol O-acyltransferase / wax synthase
VQQLSGADSLFLTMDNDRVFGHVSSVCIIEASEAPEPITCERVREVFASRLHLLPMFRRRVVEVPFQLDHPYWAEDPDFDIDDHVREVKLRRPGGARQLVRVAAKLVSTPLDRDRPLWRTSVITGIEGGRVGLLTTIHHAAIDGVAGNDVLTRLLDATPEPRELEPPPPWEPDPLPSPLDLMNLTTVSLATRPLRFLELQRDFAHALTEAVRNAVAGGAETPGVLRPTQLRVPRTCLNRMITTNRSWAFQRLSLGDCKAVKNAFGYTVNDVVLAICAGALRRWLVEHDALPSQPLVAGVPLSLRSPGDENFGNRVSMMTGMLPTHLDDPLDRLHAAHESMAGVKRMYRAIPASVLQNWPDFSTPGFAAIASREAAQMQLANWMNPPWNVVVSNVPGPQYPLYFAGAPLVAIFPLSAIADGQALNISLLGYLDGLHFGLLACPDVVPDVDDLAHYLDDELGLLVAATRAETPRGDASRKRKSSPKKRAAAKRNR